MSIIRDFRVGKTGKKTTGYKGCKNDKNYLDNNARELNPFDWICSEQWMFQHLSVF